MDWRETTSWQSLGAVVTDLKASVERAYHEGREADAERAHDDLTAAEWRLDRAERLRGRDQKETRERLEPRAGQSQPQD